MHNAAWIVFGYLGAMILFVLMAIAATGGCR